MLRCRLAGLVVALALVSHALAAQTPDPLAPFKRAVALQEAGDLDAAAAAYREFLNAYPRNVEARSNLGVVLARLGRYEEAIAAYREALVVDSGNTHVRLNLGLALYKATHIPEAAREFQTVLAANPNARQARYLLADCHLRMGEAKKVIELLAPDEAARTDDLALAYMLGTAYLQEGQTDKGQILLDRILRHGDSAEARLMMGMVKRRAQDLAGGLEDLGKAATINPELPRVHALYGQALLETGNRDAARVQFLEELKRNPVDFDANLSLGVMLKDEAQFEQALAHFERALLVRPGDIATRYQIATVRVATGKSEAALPLLESVVKDAPKFVEARVSLATVYYRLKRKEDGDRERAVVEELNREIQAKQPGAVAPNPKPPSSGGVP
jgi:tetratricopeptide (TPR) repeat protein